MCMCAADNFPFPQRRAPVPLPPQALCINESVLALGSPGLINERCLEMQRAKAGTKPGGKAGGKVWPREAAAPRAPALHCVDSLVRLYFVCRCRLLHALAMRCSLSGRPPLACPAPHLQKSSGRCPFLACGTQAAATTQDLILAQPLDIEELAALGG